LLPYVKISTSTRSQRRLGYGIQFKDSQTFFLIDHFLSVLVDPPQQLHLQNIPKTR